MTRTEQLARPKPGEIAIAPTQVRPGVHVRIPLAWMDHQFLRNAFVVENDDQVRQLAALGIPQFMCDVTRCRVPPLPLPESPPPAPSGAEAAHVEALNAALAAEKQARIRAMQDIREHLAHTHRHYVHASKAIGSAIGRFSAAPGECMSAIEQVSAESAAVILSDMDSAMVLITEKAQHDGFAAHALSVMTLSLLLARQARLPEEALRTLGVGALLHDIGELDLSPSIVRNMDRGRHEESAYRAHCALGAERLRQAGNVPAAVVQAARSHHECHDGSGFPDGLAGDAVPISARVIAIANRFDNLVNPIDVRRAVSPSEALSLMWVREKRSFDPVLLQLFVRAVGVYPPGTIVQLTDGHVGAVVLSATTDDPLSPQVMLYEPDVARSHAIIVDLADDRSVRIDRSLRLAERPQEELDYLLPRRRMGWFLDRGKEA